MSEGLRAAVITAAAFAAAWMLDPAAAAMERGPGLTAVARFLSALGDGGLQAAFCAALLAAGYALRESRLREAGFRSLLALGLSSVWLHLLKAAFERPRMAHADGALTELLNNPVVFDTTGRFNSFPSGHTTTSFAIAFVLARYYPRLAPLFYALASLVGLSRVALGSHYPTDIVGGAVLGLASAYFLVNRTTREQRIAALVLFLAIFVSFFKLGGFLLFDVDEAVFSEATREMVETGDFITPTYNYEPRYDKPVLFYWLMAVSYKVFGTGHFGARAVSAFLGVALCAVTYLFVRRVRDAQAAAFSTLVLAANIEFFVYSHSAVTDMTLCFFITASLYSAYLALTGGDGRWWYGFWGASALAVLTKGVVGLLFPAAVTALYLIFSGAASRLAEPLRPGAVALFLAVALPWFVAVYAANGWEFIDAFIIKHHIRRYTGVISGHSGPVYFFVVVLLVGFFPWYLWLPGGLVRGVAERGGLFTFAALWFLFVFVFFSLSRTKLPNYIFPLWPAASIMVGTRLAEIVRFNERWKGFYALAAVSVLAALPLLVLPFVEIRSPVPLRGFYFVVPAVLLLLVAAAAFLALRHRAAGIAAMGLVTVCLLVFLRTYVVPPANLFLQGALYDYALYGRGLGEGYSFVAYDINRPSLAFYYGGRVPKLDRGELSRLASLGEDGAVVVVTAEERFDELKAAFPALKFIDARNGYLLVGIGEEFPPIGRFCELS
ncbi:MAG TPA: phosphatase PAP2 family protein [Deltaproteobacteria bacterium]|nr:phosphatase PAP2 family protein [Deltaproteobacteria bacterium]